MGSVLNKSPVFLGYSLNVSLTLVDGSPDVVL
jgi:hypothetical protein